MRLVYGWGINDANYVVQPTVNGKRVICPFYQTWRNMLQRCYCEKYHEMRPTYRDCEVCSEWKSFMAFKAWMETQDWEGKQLDKDLIGDKLYSPETCCFVEGWLNSIFNDHGSATGDYPVGVSLNKETGKFYSYLNVLGVRKHNGLFDTPEEASDAYRTTKLNHVQGLMANYPDQRIKQAVLNKAQTLYGETPCVSC